MRKILFFCRILRKDYTKKMPQARQNGDFMHVPFTFTAASGSFWESVVEWYQKSVICELLTYLEEKYFSVSLGSYQNLSISATTGTTIRNTILAIAIGLIIASAMMVHTRRGLGKFIHALLKNNCNTPDNAKTLSELGFYQNPSLRHALKKGVTFGKLVRCKEEDEWLQNESFTDETAEEKPTERKEEVFAIDCSTMHFYVPEEFRYRAEIRFEKKGTSWGFFAIVAVLTVIACALLCVFLPSIFKLTDNIITLLSP